MIRKKLIENIMTFGVTENYILSYLTKHDFAWFVTENGGSDEEVEEVILNAFKPYFGYTKDEGTHPFYIVYQRLTEGANIEKLFYQTDLYGNVYQNLAEIINLLYTSEKRDKVHMILKAFAERDFEELANRYCYDEDFSVETMVNNIEVYADEVASNLDTRDLQTIIWFCGEN